MFEKYEIFFDSGPLATLPMLKNNKKYYSSSLIWSHSPDYIKNLDRIKTFYVDMQNEETILDMWNKIDTKMDIIIDDGFHSYDANINLFRNSFKHLKNPGYYIIEDVHRKPSNIKKFNNFFLNEKIKYEIIDIPHKNNIHDNCLILIRKD